MWIFHQWPSFECVLFFLTQTLECHLLASLCIRLNLCFLSPIDDLKANTEYHKYQANSLQIIWFWRALRSFDQTDKAKFMQFVTGSSKVIFFTFLYIPYLLQCNLGVLFFKIKFWVRFYSNLTHMGLYSSWGSNS